MEDTPTPINLPTIDLTDINLTSLPDTALTAALRAILYPSAQDTTAAFSNRL